MCSTDDIGGSALNVMTLGQADSIPTVPELTGEEAAKEAARRQQAVSQQNIAAQNQLTEEQARQFDLMREDYAPFRQVGVSQLPMLQQMAQQGGFTPSMQGFEGSPESQIGNVEDFQASPSYQFALEQGLGAIQNSAAAGGGLESGRTLKALQGYGQNLANQEYQNWYGRRANEFANYANRENAQFGNQFNRLAALAGVGQTATGQMSNLGQNQLAMQQQGAQNIMGQNQMMANANAAASMQGYQGMSNLIGQGMQTGGLMYALSDERAKDDIEDAKLGLDFVKKLRPVRWKYKGDDETHDGLIAQELKAALEGEGVDGAMHVDGEMQGINYGELIGPLIKAVQELDAKVEARNG